jgi:hypothetical protein
MRLLRLKWTILGLLGCWCVLLSGICTAEDLRSLDRVSVHMDRSTVRSILGSPDGEIELSIGLTAELYQLEGLGPLIGKGCVYSEKDQLVGQAFIFEGSVVAATTESLENAGFRLVKKSPQARLLAGTDDDSGRPILVSISEKDGLTSVVTFEKTFYEGYGERGAEE